MHSSARMSDHRSQAMKSNESRSCCATRATPFPQSRSEHHHVLAKAHQSQLEPHHHTAGEAPSASTAECPFAFELHSNACCTLPQMRSTLNQAAPDAQHTKPCRKDHLEHNSPHAEPSAKLKQFPPCGRTIATSITDRSSTIRSQQSQVTA